MSAPPRNVVTHRGFVPIGLLLGILGGAFGYGVGRYAALGLGAGFKVDWYRYTPPATLDVEHAAAVVALVAAVVGVLTAGFGLSLAYREWNRRLTRGRAPPPDACIGSRGAHAASVFAGLGLGLPVLLALLAYSALSALAIERVNGPEGYPLLGSVAGAFAGFAGTYFSFAPTGRALAHGRLQPVVGEDNAFARIALFSGRNRKSTLAVLLATTLVLGFGLTLINTNVDVADVLPRGNPNTDAAHNLTEKFKSSFTLQVTFQLHTAPEELYAEDLKKIPFRTNEPKRLNITDEVYIRATDELVEFAKSYRDPETGQASPFVSSVALSDFYRLINWTIAGGRNANASAYEIPPPTPDGEMRYGLVNQTLWAALYATGDAVSSPDFAQAAALVTVSPKEELSGKEIGALALKIRDAYVQWAERDPDAYKVFTGENKPLFSVDLPIANAHSSELAGKDFKRLLPVIGAWLAICVFLAFRNLSSILIAIAALSISVVWTFGIMGFMGIPLNTLNLTVIPLVMGVGIDYGIHTLNEYQENRAHGKSNEETFRKLGARGFLALFVATLNTVVGLLVMVASPSLLIAQLGILSSIAISSSFLITITFMPAALSALPEARAHQYTPSPLMGATARGVSHFRVGVVLVLLVVTSAAYAAQANLRIEEFGDPPRNWLPDDPLRKEHQVAIEGFYASENDDIKANILIFEGDVTDPAAHRYMDSIEATLKRCPVGKTDAELCPDGGLIITDTLRTLPFLVRTYLTVRDGVPGAGEYIALSDLAKRFEQAKAQDPYPDTREEIRALLDEVHETPLSGLANLFFDHPDDHMAMMLFSVKAASYENATDVWTQVMAALRENEDVRPTDMHVSFFGNTAINYLFVAEELPWVAYMSIVTNVLVLAFVYIPTRSVRATLVVGVLNFLTSLWWLALLPFFGVGLAITLTLPLVFIYAIGSDYGLHLAMSASDTRDTEETFRTTGKAVLFSAISTFGAFLIYTQMSNLAVRRTMIATAVAIPVILVVTLLVVPLFYPTRRKEARARAAARPAASRAIIELPPPPAAKTPVAPVRSGGDGRPRSP